MAPTRVPKRRHGAPSARPRLGSLYTNVLIRECAEAKGGPGVGDEDDIRAARAGPDSLPEP